MKLTQGSIVITSFPFADKKGQKLRPAPVVSNSNFNKNSSDIWITVITSQSKYSKHKLPILPSHLTEGKLLKESYIKCTSLTYIAKNLIEKQVAKVSRNKMEEVLKEVAKILDPTND